MVWEVVNKGLRWLWVVVAGALLCGCGAEKPVEVRAVLVPVDTIHLQEPDTLFLGEFRSLEITLHPFRLYVPDFRLGRVVVYDSLGRPVQTIGRPGFDEPGTLQRPVRVLFHKNMLYVEESGSRITRFTLTGRFLDRPRFPEGYLLQFGLRRLDAERLVVPSIALAEPCSDWFKPACPETRSISVVDTGLSQVLYRFGQYPQMYLEGSYIWRFVAVDIHEQRQIAAVVYAQASELQFYALGDTSARLLRRVALQHPAWQDPPQEMPADLLVNDRDRFNALLLQSSSMEGVYFAGDTLVLAYFFNMKPSFFEHPGWSDTDIQPYGVLASLSGRWQQALALPGPVLGRDEAFHLYIRLSDEPDRRLIGRFRVEVRP